MLRKVGSWEPVSDTYVSFELTNEAPVLLSYTATLLALHADASSARGADALGAASGASVDASGGGGASVALRHSVAQMRLVVDGTAHRASASHASAAAGGGSARGSPAALADGCEGAWVFSRDAV